MRIIVLFTFLIIACTVFAQQKSLDEIDIASYNAGKSPFEHEFVSVKMKSRSVTHSNAPADIMLDGMWQMVEGGTDSERLLKNWNSTIPAEIPGSIHTALWKAGKIPDPYLGQNDSIARRQSFKTWWLKKEFDLSEKLNQPQLIFGGVAIHCTVWLNGEKLGEHEGMFGAPEYDISKYLKKKNTLIVKIDPAPYLPWPPNSKPYDGLNTGWRETVVFNNVYGWHYSNMPSLGIWRPVRIKNQASVEIESLFVAAKDTSGQLNLEVILKKVSSTIKGELQVSIIPDNFIGKSTSFSYNINSSAKTDTLLFSFKVPDPKLWWPNGIGEQNLYKLEASFLPENNQVADFSETIFGIRTIDMAPLPGGPYPDKYNWTFIVNGEKHFIKGTGWCTMDAMMDFSRERYDRFLSLAKLQHIQMLRGWGSGMPETDEFYDLCNRYGIMVMQEWPTAWNSHIDQPFDALEETVKLNTIRIRNNPSLVMYGGGNESDNPFGEAIDMMGRNSIELDGTRPFHRGEPWGGSDHNYNCWWNKAHLNNNLNMTSQFWGEFGIASLPVKESVLRYIPDSEKSSWPLDSSSVFAHHTPVFNTAEDITRLEQYSGYFMPNDNMKDFIIGSQLAQVVAVRHTLERARTLWPDCTGALYYKMNDNYPAASWSCVDWYGAPKPMHYFAQDAFSPVASIVLFDNTKVTSLTNNILLPVYLLDDNLELEDANWKVTVRAFDQNMQEIRKVSFDKIECYQQVNKLGEFTITKQQAKTYPLFIVSEIQVNGTNMYRTFYFMNFEKEKGCLFDLPNTSLSLETKEKTVTVKNTGKLPAVGVNLQCPGQADKFTVSDNFFWLNPGEIKTVKVNITDNVIAEAWNVE